MGRNKILRDLLSDVLEIIFRYTKRFTALSIKRIVVILKNLIATKLFRTIHLLRKPGRGGTPPKFAIIIKLSDFSVAFVCVEIFCNFRLLANFIEKITAVQ